MLVLVDRLLEGEVRLPGAQRGPSPAAHDPQAVQVILVADEGFLGGGQPPHVEGIVVSGRQGLWLPLLFLQQHHCPPAPLSARRPRAADHFGTGYPRQPIMGQKCPGIFLQQHWLGPQPLPA